MLSEQQQKQLLSDIRFLKNQVRELQEAVNDNAGALRRVIRTQDKFADAVRQEIQKIYKLLDNKRNKIFGRDS